MNRFVLPALATLWFLAPGVRAEEWPQWMGPDRDNVWRETGLLEEFPNGGPPVIWRTEIAGGYAGPAVAAGRVFVMDYITSDNVRVANFEREKFSGIERVLCLDEATGEILWQYRYAVDYDISYPAGPRCTPAVDGDRVYTLGAEGHLACLEVGSGEVVWAQELKEAYETTSALWGYAAHPLIDGDKLITLAGGRGSHVVALNKYTGEEIWRSLTSPEQGYSPPTIIEAGGVRQLILLRPNAVTSVDPETGEEYWSVPYEADSGSIIMSPVRVGDYLYVAGYSRRSLLLRLNGDEPGAEIVWRDRTADAISPVNVQPFVVGSVVYGCDQSGRLCALELPEGKRLWQSTQPMSEGRPAGNGTAFLVRQGERFWMFTDSGDLVIARLTPEGYEEVDRAHVIEPTNVASNREVVWSMPAFANRRAYIRNDNEIICVDLSGDSAER